MTDLDVRPTLPAIGASHEQIVFSKMNVRAPRRLSDARERFVVAVSAIDDLAEGAAVTLRFLDEQNQNDSWYVSRFGPSTVPISPIDASRFVVFALRRESDPDDGQVVAIDRNGRWMASAMPSRLSPREGAASTELFIKTIASIGSSPEFDDIEYDVDLVCTPEKIAAWLRDHPFIVEVTLWTWRPNGSNIDASAILDSLDELAARRVRQHFQNYPGRSLRVTDDTAQSIGRQTANGNGRIMVTAQDSDGWESTFDSFETPESVQIRGQVESIQDVIQRTLGELKNYVQRLESAP